MSADERGRKDTEQLLREAERLRRSIEATEASLRRKESATAAATVGRQAAGVQDAFSRAVAGARWFWVRVAVPIATHRWVAAVLRWYGRLWRRAVYRRNAAGEAQFSKGRASAMVVATGVALWLLPAFVVGTVGFISDAAWMAATYRSSETWYLGKSQELDFVNNVFSAQGCASVNCTDQTSVYFRIEPSLAHHLWSLVRNRNIFFPEFVAAGIQNDVNKCRVIAYGARWKLLVRNWGMYPQILAVDCVPVTESEIEAFERALSAPLAPVTR